ncbi:MAG: M48 family metallopeptidase [Elainella sp. Prado103]|jgi:predicted Zn-dependent protease|nr:M48 family metallopeptidase [Elainella sp. Prado103]
MKYLRRLIWATLGIALFVSLSSLLPFLAQSNSNSRFQILAEADRLYLAGDQAGAEELYRQVKPPFPNEQSIAVLESFSDPAQLSPSGQANWNVAQAAKKKERLAPLNQLVEQEPAFIPGQIAYAEALDDADDEDEAIAALEQASARFPDSLELTEALVTALEDDGKRLEASIAARQFAIVNPDHPRAAEFQARADENLGRYRRRITERNVLQGVLGGVVGIITGDGGERAIGAAAMLLQGESALGSQVAAGYRQQLTPVTDPEIVAYVTEIGNSIAELMGRSDFEYEFNVVQDDSFNAFALPGGKVFVHTGLLLSTNSEAEFAGVMAHEVAHAVLSHGFQKMTRANLLSNLSAVIPLGDLVATLIHLDYSRQQERQADMVGTRVLATAGYAADGTRNSFLAMKTQERGTQIDFLSSHPLTDDRIDYLEKFIVYNGYNRYAFEGVERHARIQERLKQIL